MYYVLCSTVWKILIGGGLIWILVYLLDIMHIFLILSIDSIQVVKWWVDSSIEWYTYGREHTSATISMGWFPIVIGSKNHNLNTCSLIEVEVVISYNRIPQILCTRYLLMDWGNHIIENIFYQGNNKIVLLETNGKT